VVAIFSTALLQGRATKIFGDGTATRDYVYVGDVVEAFVRATGQVGDGRRYNIGTGLQTSVTELHGLVATAVGVTAEPTYADPRVGELQAIALDCAAAGRDLGWTPATDMPAGIAGTVDWIRGHVAG
jgi:UDP-glucose 4-epimerase